MKETRFKRRVSLFLVLVMSINLLCSSGTVFADTAESSLSEIVLKVTQQGTEISEGGQLVIGDPFGINVTFRVPVLGDIPTPVNTVKKGDTATFSLGDGFELLSNSSSVPLKDQVSGLVVGHVAFDMDDSTGMSTAKVVFDGDDAVFNGDYNTVRCGFSLDLQLPDDGSGGGNDEKLVTILGKTFVIVPPPQDIKYTLTKTGTADLKNGVINWNVKIGATVNDKHTSLSGYHFFDDLTDVGSYVENSFRVDSSPVPPSYESNILKYTFPENSVSEKTVTFQTKIADSYLFANKKQSITNKAQLLNSTEQRVAEGSKTVEFTPVWIKKEGTPSDTGDGDYEPTDRTITWKITVNQNEVPLKNVVITDVLDSRLTFVSATLQSWNGTGWNPAESISPNGSGEYILNDIHTQMLLTIVTQVPDDDFTGGTIKYTNHANVRWTGNEAGYDSGTIEVPIGYSAISKSGKAHPESGTITWTVRVNTKGQSIPKKRVFDLLVYGDSKSGFSLGSANGFPDGITPGDITPRYSQKYLDASFIGNELTITVHPITQDGIRVADLLEITGFADICNQTFTFESQITSPEIYANNKTTTVNNTATLFSQNKKLFSATADAPYKSRVLAKAMLPSAAVENPLDNVNSISTNPSNGFNYEEKTVIFRLEVNANSMALHQGLTGTGGALGTITVKDTLPEGWEFLNIAENTPFYLFEGTANTDGTITATGLPLNTLAGLTANISGRTADFSFESLRNPYVILLKAAPTTETALEYFSKNGQYDVKNTVSLTAENAAGSINASQDVTVISKVLDKELEVPRHGMLLWTVDYCAYDLTELGNKLVDTLPAGIDLRRDAAGALLITGNITAHELDTLPDGSRQPGAPITLEEGENLLYDSDSKELTFLLADSKKAYRFTYVTDITGSTGTIENHVSLYNQTKEQEGDSKSYEITAADGEASLKQNGWITIIKTDEAGTALPGAEFTVFAQDNETVIRRGTTDNDGILILRGIPAGSYILQETAAPEGFEPDATPHTVTVSYQGTTVFTSIDGNEGEDASSITIVNTPVKKYGQLNIRKEVTGTGADTEKTFDFKVTFDAAGSYRYTGSGISDGTIQSRDIISLAHGQSITILDLPENTSYTVTELEDSAQGYQVSSTGSTGTIAADTVSQTVFVNTKTANPTGSLTIGKTVSGSGADSKKAFRFTLTLSAQGSFPYTGVGVPSGSLKSGDSFTLSHGQSITLTGLPKDTDYTVKEDDYTSQGYTVNAAGTVGSIQANTTAKAAFVNTREAEKTGSLALKKTVTGTGADTKKAFSFKIILEDSSDSYTYTGTKSGTLRSGDSITLCHNEHITITGLPAGIKYEIQEADYTKDGYTATAKNAQGVIKENETRNAAFTNKYQAPKKETPKTGDDSGNGMRMLKWIFGSALFLILSGSLLFLRRKKSKASPK